MKKFCSTLSCFSYFLCILLFATDARLRAEDGQLSSWSAVTVGVADIDQALALWIDEFGMEMVNRKEGSDSDLASLWDISATDIVRQALIRTPGIDTGMIHLVEFRDPAPAVRENAEVFDLCPKNLDVYVQDLPARFTALKENGHTFRADNYSEVTAPNGISFREIHMPSHDHINVVLLEVLGVEMPFSPAGFAAVGPLIMIVPDATEEKDFFHEVIGLDILSDNILEGPEFEKMIGLPPGSALDVSIWGREEYSLGQIEIIEYRGVSGRNLYPLARPKSLGILHVAYAVADLAAFRKRLTEQNIPFTDYTTVSTLHGSGAVVTLFSPAGLRIEVHERS